VWFFVIVLVLGSSSGEVEEQCAGDPAEEAEFTSDWSACLCKACIEPFLERAFFPCGYSFAVSCLRLVSEVVRRFCGGEEGGSGGR
jgi:hypothetical protein